MTFQFNESEKIVSLDNTLQTFSLDGSDKDFKCVPNKTSNFDIFRLSNPNLSDVKAQAIWDYYREMFINVKMTGDDISSFRRTLQRFIEGKPYSSSQQLFNSRTNDINSYIGLARWLELQYNVDTTISQLSENTTTEQMEEDAKRVLGTVPFNNYVSYFSTDIHKKLKDPADYNNRKLKIRSVYEYTHKQIRWYICASEYGAVKVWVHCKHNAFLPMFEKLVKGGVTVNIVTSKVLSNIDNTTPYIKVENFFLDS
jgi:hypothetical protein